jgi:hypothetical protein
MGNCIIYSYYKYLGLYDARWNSGVSLNDARKDERFLKWTRCANGYMLPKIKVRHNKCLNLGLGKNS